MKEILENFDVLYFLAAVTCISVLLKFIGFILFKKLLRDSSQMGTTDNKWMKSMMAKFEAYYKLRISVHNVENFVDRYLYHYHFLGMSLQSWEYVECYMAVVTVAASALFCMAAGYYQLTVEWFMVMGFCVVSLLIIQGLASILFNTHRSRKIFRIQLIDYMENTMRARLENEYFNEEATRQYQMEYFDEDDRSPAQAAAVMEQGEMRKSMEEQAQEDLERELFAQSDSRDNYQGKRQSMDFQSQRRKRNEKTMRQAASDRKLMREEEQAASKQQSQWSGSEIRDLLTSLIEELQIDKDIEKKQQELSEHTASVSVAEKAQLFEEILREYI